MMRDTGDMMEDAFSEDTMMECSGDDADLDDLVDLADEVSNSTPTIRDAAERLLTLLGVENNEDGDDFSSSEDEGVELDEDSEDENDLGDDLVDVDDGTRNTRLLHQLANSLAQELKCSAKKANKSRLSGSSSSSSSSRATRTFRENDDHCMEVAQDVVYFDDTRASLPSRKFPSLPKEFPSATSREIHDATTTITEKSLAETTRIRTSGDLATRVEKDVFSVSTGLADSWSHGWDTCAAEAIRYLVEDEGLSPHHPTVLAMKSHLETQRERTLARETSGESTSQLREEKSKEEMIPESEKSCETAGATIATVEHTDKQSTKSQQETEVASITAWKRYENFVSSIESMGGSYNRKLTIEAMFRGGDLIYASH